MTSQAFTEHELQTVESTCKKTNYVAQVTSQVERLINKLLILRNLFI